MKIQKRKSKEKKDIDESNKNFFSISDYLKKEFGSKVVKLSIDGGFTCPNRDGRKSSKACLFCSENGSGEFAGTIPEQIELLSTKWPNAKYLAYFQNHTNTYAPVSELREKFEEALSYPGILGIAIATRPDCLDDDVLELLNELNKKTFLWVELGLQTIHEKTANLINRCYPLSVYDDAIKKLHNLNIKTVTHLILGLPGETQSQMEDSVKYICSKDIFGIKFHMLNVVKGSRMAVEYPDYIPFSSKEEYIELVCDLVELVPKNITIHRLSADAPRPILIAPSWSYEKRTILNGINSELRKRRLKKGI